MPSPRSLRTPRILPGSPTHRAPTPTLPGRRGLAYLDDAAAPGGRPHGLQEARLAVSRGPRGTRQRDPAATVPPPTPGGPSHAFSGGGVRTPSGVVFTSGCVGRRGTLPARGALGHGRRFELSRGDGTPGSGVQPLGTSALLHPKAAPPDFVSPPGGGGGGNFLERRHRSAGDVRGLRSGRPAVRRGTAAGTRRRRERAGAEAKRRGRCPKRDADARSAPDKRHPAPGRAASEAGTRAAWGGGAGVRRPRPVAPATCPQSAAQRPQEVRRRRRRPPLRSVVTGREDLF